MREVLDGLCRGDELPSSVVEEVFAGVVRGEADEVQLAAFLAALRTRGETPLEVAGAARALLASARPFPRPDYPFADLVGTGGDGSGTWNLSTAAALTVAACGLPVAKHGNRSISSSCGSADVLESLGVRLDPEPEVARRGLDATGFCFLFAPHYHPGVRHAMPVRQSLGIRTVMNLLGPLVNPARPSLMLVGVYDPAVLRLAAGALAELQVERAAVVHGAGLDEVAPHAPTEVVRLTDGRLEDLSITPGDAGLTTHPLSELNGGDPADNAQRLRSILAGEGSQGESDSVALNAGVLLWVAGRAASLPEAVAKASKTLADGRPLEVLEAYAEISHG